MLKEQEQFQMHIQLLKMNMQEEKVMMYLKENDDYFLTRDFIFTIR
jgi:hypothetical protein